MKKILPIILCILFFVGLTSASLHRFYVSIYQVKYVSEKKMLQITSRIFIDDLNDVLEQKFHKKTYFGTEKETQEDVQMVKKYLSDRLVFTVNGQKKAFIYIGSEVENNAVVCYLSIRDISKLATLEIENTVLTELHPEQQNIIQFDVNGKKQSLLLTSENATGMLK